MQPKSFAAPPNRRVGRFERCTRFTSSRAPTTVLPGNHVHVRCTRIQKYTGAVLPDASANEG